MVEWWGSRVVCLAASLPPCLALHRPAYPPLQHRFHPLSCCPCTTFRLATPAPGGAREGGGLEGLEGDADDQDITSHTKRVQR